MKKILALVLALAASPVSVALADTPAAAPQELLWASDGEANVPYVFHDPAHESRMTGFEYELADAIAERLHRKATFIQNDWDGLIPGLSRGLYGMVLDGIEMTPEHKAAVLFSRPYYVTSERIIVRHDQTGLDTMEALKGHTVGTVSYTHLTLPTN
mgnify:FL=1